MVLHCGDIEEPPIIELFRGWTAHFVLGNCDHDKSGLARAIAGIGATLHENFGHVEVGSTKIAFTHGHDRDLLTDLEKLGAYDFLFHGHTHIAVDRQAGPTRVINPGALHRAAIKSFVLLHTVWGGVQTIEVD
jgi:putative phosphoesterase